MTDWTLLRTPSRRNFLKTTAALAVAHCVPGMARDAMPETGKTFAYVGTYTGTPGAGGNGEGIYLFEMNTATGELSERKLAAKTPNPSWIAIHPSRQYLYAVNEIADFHGNSGSVSAFAIHPGTGALHPLNTVSSEGAGPAHLSLDASGRYAFVANYAGGSVAVLPILADGSLGSAVDVHLDHASLGSIRATNAPPGSFAISGHDAPHAHMIAADPQNNFVLATDLGQDRIYTYRLNPATGRLTPAERAPFVALPSGDGPRHFAFHPNGHWLYAIQEESSTIVFFLYDADTGQLTAQQTLSALPQGFAGSSFASEILVSPDGKTLYAANRLHDTIAVFAIDARGRLEHIGETSTQGDYPVQCRIGPGGSFLYVCNRRSDNITSFRIHRDTGLLTFTGHYTPVGSPASIAFLP
ncbi:MAG: lactonase family protein [Acidobacteriota bacterium]|nr:lactonase family protein [Acidobacteriota bacterium]